MNFDLLTVLTEKLDKEQWRHRREQADILLKIIYDEEQQMRCKCFSLVLLSEERIQDE